MLTEEQRQYIQQNYGVQTKSEKAQILDSSKIDEEIARLRSKTQEKEPEKKGFLGNMAKEIGRSFLQTGARFATTYSPTAKILDQTGVISKNILPEKVETPLGDVQIRQSEDLKKEAGFMLEDIANVYGGGGTGQALKAGVKGLVKSGAKEGLKAGVVGGGLGLAGREMQEGGSLGDILKQGAIGSLFSGAIGSVAGGAIPAVSAGVRKILAPVEQKVSNTISQAIDKGIKPYFGGKYTQAMRDTYNKKAGQAFSIINKYKPAIFDDTLGEEIVKSPTSRKEMLLALDKTKKALFQEYSQMAEEAGEQGAKFNVNPIQNKLYDITQDLSYSPQIRSYADNLINEVSELQGQSPLVIQKRIEELNQSLAGFYEGRINKAKAQLDASTAKAMREQLDETIENVSGEGYQSLKNQYSSLKTVEKDLARQVNLEARKQAKGFFDLTDVFTGGDLVAGALTANPSLMAKGLAGRGFKEYIKYLNDPNRYIKNAFDILDNPPADIKQAIINANEYLSKRAGLSKLQKVLRNL